MQGETAAARESQVTTQCKRLEENLEKAEDSLAALEARLESVLAPSAPVGGPGKEEEQLTPHAALLRRQADAVQQLVDGLNSLRGRIEL